MWSIPDCMVMRTAQPGSWALILNITIFVQHFVLYNHLKWSHTPVQFHLLFVSATPHTSDKISAWANATVRYIQLMKPGYLPGFFFPITPLLPHVQAPADCLELLNMTNVTLNLGDIFLLNWSFDLSPLH